MVNRLFRYLYPIFPFYPFYLTATFQAVWLVAVLSR